jgi:hypothetical protein
MAFGALLQHRSAKSGLFKRSPVMVNLYPHPPASGRHGFRGQKPFPHPGAWIVLKTIDRDEQLILNPRDSGLRNKIWEGGGRIVLLSIAVLLALLILCLLGVILFGGLGPLGL